MPSCVVRCCKNHSDKLKKQSGITFHKFPRELSLKNKWIRVIRTTRKENKWLPSDFSVICSIHFEEDDFYITKCGRRRAIKNAIPKKMLGVAITKKEDGNKEKEIKDSNSVSSINEVEIKASTPNPGEPIEYENVQAQDFCAPILDVQDSDLESELDTPMQSRLRHQLRRKIQIVNSYKKKIKFLNQKVRRLTKRNLILKHRLRELKGTLRATFTISNQSIK